jgi:hypothetical protein
MSRREVAIPILILVICLALLALDRSSETTVYRCMSGNEVVYFSDREPHPALNYKTCAEIEMPKGDYFDAKHSFHYGSNN